MGPRFFVQLVDNKICLKFDLHNYSRLKDNISLKFLVQNWDIDVPNELKFFSQGYKIHVIGSLFSVKDLSKGNTSMLLIHFMHKRTIQLRFY